MKIRGLSYAPTEKEFEIEGITLLSVEEAEKIPKTMLACEEGWWWLCSPGDLSNRAACVHGDGSVDYYGDYVDNGHGCVRPALLISDLESSDLKFGDKIEVLGHTWTVISEDMALCDSIIECHTFREDWEAEDANDYERSDVKKYLENWLKERTEEQENKNMPAVRVWQANRDSDELFLSLRDLGRINGWTHPVRENYRLVYEGDPGTTDLDELYTLCNINHPEGYLGHSMSVSDIVEIYGKPYFCDAFGFVELGQDWTIKKKEDRKNAV